MNYNVLFYSNQCDYCNTVLKQLQQYNIPDSELIRICVDNNKNIPSYITKVPTVISKTHKQPIIDEAVFMWINTLLSKSNQRSNHQQHPIQQHSNQQQQPHPSQQQSSQPPPYQSNQPHQQSQPQQPDQSPDSINPYSPIEMTSSYSDSFSYLDNSESNITHNFAFLDQVDNGSGNNAQQEQSNKPEKEDEYTKYMAERDADPEIQQPMRRI
jgi:hypothetical protein